MKSCVRLIGIALVRRDFLCITYLFAFSSHPINQDLHQNMSFEVFDLVYLLHSKHIWLNGVIVDKQNNANEDQHIFTVRCENPFANSRAVLDTDNLSVGQVFMEMGCIGPVEQEEVLEHGLLCQVRAKHLKKRGHLCPGDTLHQQQVLSHIWEQNFSLNRLTVLCTYLGQVATNRLKEPNMCHNSSELDVKTRLNKPLEDQSLLEADFISQQTLQSASKMTLAQTVMFVTLRKLCFVEKNGFGMKQGSTWYVFDDINYCRKNFTTSKQLQKHGALLPHFLKASLYNLASSNSDIPRFYSHYSNRCYIASMTRKGTLNQPIRINITAASSIHCNFTIGRILHDLNQFSSKNAVNVTKKFCNWEKLLELLTTGSNERIQFGCNISVSENLDEISVTCSEQEASTYSLSGLSTAPITSISDALDAANKIDKYVQDISVNHTRNMAVVGCLVSFSSVPSQ